jgi:pimeloyl-ACP methyl ester carboxylesterase
VADLVLLSAHGSAVWANVEGVLATRARLHMPSLDGHDTLPAAAEAVLAVAPPRFALAGLCVGGYLALEIVARAPERVVRLALLHSSARADSEAEAQRRTRRIASLRTKAKNGYPSPAYAREALPWMIAPAGLRDPDLVGRVEALLMATSFAAGLRQQMAMASRRDRRGDLATLRLPTLVATGAVDRIAPPALSREMAERIPAARLEVIADCGHLSPLEQSRRLAALMIDWMDADQARTRSASICSA